MSERKIEVFYNDEPRPEVRELIETVLLSVGLKRADEESARRAFEILSED